MRSASFFDAHEEFEGAWRAAAPDSPGRPVLKALAQLAASHHQLVMGKGRAAVRTWHKARGPLLTAGMIDPGFCAAMDELHARAGVTAEGPRFIDPARCGPPQSFPRLDDETLYTPSA